MRLDEFDPTENARDLGTGGGGGGFGGSGFGGGGGGIGGLLIGLLPMLLGRRLGCGTLALIGAVGFFLFVAPSFLSGGGGGTATPAGSAAPAGAGGDVACDTAEELFACRAMRSTEQVWGAYFQQQGQQYRAPSINFFRRGAQSGCGAAQSAMGPFYCPADQGVYIDTDFFAELSQRFGAAGDAAQAYVIAHEVGHHIQTLTGTSEQVRTAQARGGEAQSNALQVKMELQADCYAGVWAATARTPSGQPVLEAGDIEEAMTAANAIGDDTLMRQAGQRPVESMFTHGTSEQRMQWLRRGLDTRDPAQCDTFGRG